MLCLSMSPTSSRQASSQGVSLAPYFLFLPHPQPDTKFYWFGLPAALGPAPAPLHYLLGQFKEHPKCAPCCQCTPQPTTKETSWNPNLLLSLPLSNLSGSPPHSRRKLRLFSLGFTSSSLHAQPQLLAHSLLLPAPRPLHKLFLIPVMPFQVSPPCLLFCLFIFVFHTKLP